MTYALRGNPAWSLATTRFIGTHHNAALAVRGVLVFSARPADPIDSEVEDIIQADLMLCRFRHLMAELQAGATRRNNFEPWEIEILLDFADCGLSPRRRV